MTVALIVPSRDRPAQLDLLLRSIETNAPNLFTSTTVLWKCAAGPMEHGYERCFGLHRDISPNFAELEFRMDVSEALDEVRDEHVCFAMDDCVLYAPPLGNPAEFLGPHNDSIICFSLRLGRNTKRCYPLQADQVLPEGAVITTIACTWPWSRGQRDYGYPGSLDGHIFRTADVWPALDEYAWTNPNTLEDALVRLCHDRLYAQRTIMASYARSVLVGIPANRVSTTHETNRVEALPDEQPDALNERFLAGGRLSLDLDWSKVDAAHYPFRLVWES